MNDDEKNVFLVGCLTGFIITSLMCVLLIAATNTSDFEKIKQAKIQFVQELQDNGFTIKDPKGLLVKDISFDKKPEPGWTHTTVYQKVEFPKPHVIYNGKFVPFEPKDCPCQDE